MSDDLTKCESFSLLNGDGFSDEQKQQISEIAETICIEKSQNILQFGIGVQKKISIFTDTVLSSICSDENALIGDTLSELVVMVKELGAADLSVQHSLFTKIPVLGSLLDRSRKFVQRFKKLNMKIEKITDDLDRERTSLLKNIARLDRLYSQNKNFVDELNLYIAAGQMKLSELMGEPYKKLKNEVGTDTFAALRLNDFTQQTDALEKKLHELLLSRTIALQTAPQIRLIQSSSRTLVEKIQSSVLTTIPLWRSQVLIAVSLFQQKKAVGIFRESAKSTDRLLNQNSKLLKKGSVDIEALKKTNENLISTIEDTLKIQQDGRKKNLLIEEQLVGMEKELKAKQGSAE